MPPTSVHFNGSLNLADTETVMREITMRVPCGLRRIPDGETGERKYWVLYQWKKLAQLPTLEWSTPPSEIGAGAQGRMRLANGATATDVEWPDIGYANVYAESFGTFHALQNDGIVPLGVRFQV